MIMALPATKLEPTFETQGMNEPHNTLYSIGTNAHLVTQFVELE